jgi:formate hydrogenlyase subunit 3/multisubunit Na+/H+ antiporter MnhD subunit
MTTDPAIWLSAAIGIPLLGGLVVLLWPDTIIRGVRPLLAVVFAGLVVYCAANVALLTAKAPMGGGLAAGGKSALERQAPAAAPQETVARAWETVLPKFGFYLDRLSALVVLAASILVLLVTIYAWGGLAGNARRGEFLAYGLWALAGAVLAASADNLILLLIGWELVSVMLFYLVTIGGDRARYSAGKTLVMLGLGDGALLLGIVLLYFALKEPTLSLFEIIRPGETAPGASHAAPFAEGVGPLAVVAFWLFAVAGLVKAGVMPLHTWLPKAAEGAPAATMALLPASVDKLLGIYLLARAGLFIFDWSGAGALSPQLVLMILGAGTVLLATMSALVQQDLRKLVTYASIGAVGYAVLGLGVNSALGVTGAIFQVINSAIYSSLLFLCVGAIERRAGTTDLGRLAGLGRRMPITFVTMLVASLAISGVPLLSGFVSKWMIYAGLLQFAFTPDSSALGSVAVIFLVVAMFGSALTLACLVKALHSAFMGAPTRECQNAQEVGATMWLPMLVLSGLCLALGVAPYYLIGTFLSPIAQEAGLPAVGGSLGSVPFGLGLAPAGGAFWNPMLAAGLILVALAGGAMVFLLGTFRKARTVRPYHSGETSMFSTEETRFPGTGFYGTVTELFGLRTIYRDAAEGAYDLYEIVGNAGERLVGLGKELHNGVLPTYLGFCMLGLLAILAALLLPLLLGG